MPAFKTTDGSEWQIPVLTYGVKREIYHRMKVSIDEIYFPETNSFKRIAEDEFAMAEILLILVEDQIKERGLSVRQFFDLLGDEENVMSAFESLDSAIIDSLSGKKKAIILRLQQQVNEKKASIVEGIERDLGMI